MNKSLKFFLVIIAIFALRVILTPPLNQVLHPYFKFEKIFDRLVMVFAVAAAFFFVILPKLNRKESFFEPALWREYGFDFSKPWQRLIVSGFLAGAGTVLILALIEGSFGPRYFRHPILVQDVLQRFFKGLLTGLVVGTVEEFFFRGFIFTHLAKKINIWISVLMTSAFYSTCHFFDTGNVFIPHDHPSIRESLLLLVSHLEPITHRPLEILPEFTGLFLLGLLLNLAFIRTRSIFLSIGVHAGAVFLVKFQHSFIRSDLTAYHPLFGSTPYYDGPVEWAVLCLLGICIWWMSGVIASEAKQSKI